MFPWWAVAGNDEADAPRERAHAWLEGPYARVAATVHFLEPALANELLDVMRSSIDEHDVPRWATPTEFEAWLRGVLQGCASAVKPEEPDRRRLS